MKSIIGRCSVAAAFAALVLLFISGGVAQARDERRVLALKMCICGLTNLHVKDGQLRWEHLYFHPPGTHAWCKGIGTVDGVAWEDWTKSFVLPVETDSRNVAFHPVQCRGNCVLVQSPSAENGWEAIYQFDDFVLSGPDDYCVNIVIGGPPESAADQSVQHIRPAPAKHGGRPLFPGNGGSLRDESCAPNLVSRLGIR